MSTTEPFYTTVLPDGTLADPLPEMLRGRNVKISTDDEGKLFRIMQADYEFRHPKSLEQIISEQNVKPIQSIDELIPDEPAWDDDEEFFDFLEAIGENPRNYR